MTYVTRILFVAALLAAGLFAGSPARADVDSLFAGFTSVSQIGTSGMQSSYYAATQGGNLDPNVMPVLGTSPVIYPYGIGAAPSPGRYDPGEAVYFDDGLLGLKTDGANLIVQLATGIDPRAGYYDGGWQTWYSQGDMFLSVGNAAGLTGQFALLNYWPTNGSGGPQTLGSGSNFDAAQAFHAGQAGDLVQLVDSSDVTAPGGAGAYSTNYPYPPVGLDYRVYADGGNVLGNGDLTITEVPGGIGYNGLPLTWYVETWTVPLDLLSASGSFDVSLHTAFTCGNDQIGLDALVTADPSVVLTQSVTGAPVPAPGAALLGLLGLGAVGYFRRRKD